MLNSRGIVNSFIWVSIERIGTLGLLFVGTIILARFLSPSEFGMIGILTIFTAISMMLVDSGMGGSLIKEKEVTKTDYSTLFIYNIVVSFIIYFLLCLSADYIAVLYNLPQLKEILRILALSVVFNALSIVQRIKLTRELNFKAMSVITIVSMFVAVVISVGLAYTGFGVWALVIQQVLQSLLNSLFFLFYVRFIPSIQFDKTSFKKHFAFGINLMGATLINTVNVNISSSIIGKFFSLQQTGYFTQSNKLYSMPTNIIASIVDKAIFPILSKRNDPKEIILVISKLSRNIYLISFPIFLMASVLSLPMIVVVLGKEWREASWIFSILCFGGIPLVVKTMLRNVLKTLGETYCIFKCEFFSCILSLVILIFTANLSFKAMVWGIVCNNIIMMIIFMITVSKKLSYSIRLQLSNILPFLVCSIVASILLFYAISLLPTYVQPIFVFLIGVLLGFTFILTIYIVTRNKEALSLIYRLALLVKNAVL